MAKSAYALKRLAEIAKEPRREIPLPKERLQRAQREHPPQESRFMPRTGVACMRPNYVTWVMQNLREVVKLHGFMRWRRPAHILPRDQLRALPEELEGSGIYFLWRGPELMYIGQSACVAARLQSHRRRRDGYYTSLGMEFSRSTVLAHPAKGLTEIEYQYICALTPPMNRKWCP